jgi:hypothetical protein
LIAGANSLPWTGGAGIDYCHRELSDTSAADLRLDLREQIFTAYGEAGQCVEQRCTGGELAKRIETHGFAVVHDGHFRGCLRRLTFDMRGAWRP